jgi:hypothetical protein
VTAVFVVPDTVAENCLCPPVETCVVDGATETETEDADWITTDAEAFFVGSAAEVAVTVAKAGLGIAAGAVYNPAEVIEPQEPDTQPTPDTAQVTLVLELPVTFAVNCCLPFTERVTDVGETVTATLVGDPIVTLAVPTSEGFERATAVTVTFDGVGAVAGAV